MKKTKETQVKVIPTIIISILLFSLGLLLGGGNTVDCNCPQKTCPTLDTSNVHLDYDYLKENTCLLFSNYKSAYLTIDSDCNANVNCRNSAIAKDAYETYTGWKGFADTYCN